MSDARRQQLFEALPEAVGRLSGKAVDEVGRYVGYARAVDSVDGSQRRGRVVAPPHGLQLAVDQALYTQAHAIHAARQPFGGLGVRHIVGIGLDCKLLHVAPRQSFCYIPEQFAVEQRGRSASEIYCFYRLSAELVAARRKFCNHRLGPGDGHIAAGYGVEVAVGTFEFAEGNVDIYPGHRRVSVVSDYARTVP